MLADNKREFEVDGDLAVRRVQSNVSGFGYYFVGVTELYQESLCVLYAKEHGRLPASCDCEDVLRWGSFQSSHLLHASNRSAQEQRQLRRNVTARSGALLSRSMKHERVVLPALAIALIDSITTRDAMVYAAALDRLEEEASRVHHLLGIRVLCREKLDELRQRRAEGAVSTTSVIGTHL